MQNNIIYVLGGLCMLLAIGIAILLYEITKFNEKEKIKTELKFDFDITMNFMQKHIESCETEIQLKKMDEFFRIIISKIWFPHEDPDLLDEALIRLIGLTFEQESKILKK